MPPIVKEYYHDIDLNKNQLINSRLQNITTAARIILGGTLTTADKGYQVYDTNLLNPYFWDGTAWQSAGGTTPNLQQVTDVDNITSNNVVSIIGNDYALIAPGAVRTSINLDQETSTLSPALLDFNFLGKHSILNRNPNSDESSLTMPNTNGIDRYIVTTVNGVYADSLGEVTIPVGTVTSVGLSMPAAFTVSNSPVTGVGTLTVVGAGSASEYIRGDGQLSNFPSTGGGAAVNYYLNGSVNQGVFGGDTYYEMNKVPVIPPNTDFPIAAPGYVANFITDPLDPSIINIPAGAWTFEIYFSADSAGGTPSFYIELYKYDGVNFTLISDNSGTPEGITNGTAIDLYITNLTVPSTLLSISDRLAIRLYVNTSGKTITLHTQANHLCKIITTFSTGIVSLNGLNEQTQFFSVGTSGVDFNIASAIGGIHTFNLPDASATTRGALTSADWTTFNNKVAGSGTLNYVPKWSSSSALTDSSIFDNGTSVGIGTAIPNATYKLEVAGIIQTPSGINLSTSAGVKTGIYSGANQLTFWAGNNLLATYRLNGPFAGSYFEHTAGFTNTGVTTGTQNVWRLAGSVTATTAVNTMNTTQLLIDPIYNQQTFGTGILRGVYYNPIVSNLNTSQHYAWQNTTGDVLVNTTSGKFDAGNSTIATNPSFYVDSAAGRVATRWGVSDYGFIYDLAGKEIWVGDQANGWGYYGDFLNGDIKIGDVGSVFGSGYLQFLPGSSTISTNISGANQGLKISGSLRQTIIGDYDGANNSTYVKVDDINGVNIVNNTLQMQGKIDFRYPGSTTQIRIGSFGQTVGGASTQQDIIAIGRFTGASLNSSAGSSLIGLGYNAGGSITTGGTYSIHIGRNSGNGILSGNRNTLIGSGDASNIPSNTRGVIHLISGGGYDANDAATVLSGLSTKYAFIGGGFQSSEYVNDFYLGAGPYITQPSLANLNLYSPSASGTDLVGTNFTINAGRGTGTGTPGDFIVRTASATTTGTTVQSLTERVRVKGETGDLVVANLAATTNSRIVTADTTGALKLGDNGAALFDQFMVNQFSYFLPMDSQTVYDTLRVGGTLLATGTVSSLSENPMGIQYQTALAVGSIAGQYGTSMGGNILGTNFQFDMYRRFRITTNNGAQRFFAGLANPYGAAVPTNVEPTSILNCIGVAKLQATSNLYFVWNDGAGTASSLDLGAGFSGTDTAATYTLRIWKLIGVAAVNIQLTKIVTATGVATTTSTTITSDYNTGSPHYPFIWIGNNTAVTGACSIKDYGCMILKRNIINA